MPDDRSELLSVPRTSGALLSPDERYRYVLWRKWGEGVPVTWVMLNPSTADADVDDPTIRRCMGFARGWGWPGIVVVNLFAFRATEPALALRADDPYGPENEAHLADCLGAEGTMVVAAWGERGTYRNRANQVLDLARDVGVRKVYCVGRTKAGAPRHPLYVRKTQPHEVFWTNPDPLELWI